MTSRQLPELRVYFAWWTWPLVYAVLPFATLAALFDFEAARAGIIRTAALGMRVRIGGKKVRDREGRVLARLVSGGGR